MKAINHWMAALLVFAVAAFAADKKEKPKADASQAVDAGSFGVFVRGQRMMTETFTVQQTQGGSLTKAQLKESSGSSTTDQKSSLEITANGELLRYEWSQGSPVAGSLVVLPNNEFLIEKISASGTNKAAEQPFLMPNTSIILDNNFFVHRELLVWRYLGADCKPEGGSLKCQQGPAEFGVLVPQDRTSLRVKMELVGKDKVTVRGAERELLRLNLTGESFEWTLWVDPQEQFKLMRIAIPADNTEVVRD